MTQRQLAEKTGMLPSVISRILHSQTNLTLKTIGVLERGIGEKLIEMI
jgi:transcriptional regulator with XRE-family HTH domain